MDNLLSPLERDAYRAAFSDGIIDLFVGVSLLWIGAAWIWLEDFAGLAGILPAVFITPVLMWRKQFLEPRTGYVVWSTPRRRWERRNLLAAFGAGVVMFLAGIGAFLAVEGQSIDPGPWVAALPAFLLALAAFGLSFLMDARRMLAYAAVLVAGGVGMALTESNPGWPMLIGGAAVGLVGLLMLVRFVRHYPADA